ncbi:ABC transporter ATP-binding protein [Clostridium hydrogeniformans]|uniref:ABC transporter ATP-binding protein n=1 Tax=Clostridium hydrogeniformans TaxID=349933 RepID=UPI000483ED6F|nr:ABC transporter ATP-binding protein [Clostridium hydrogeniformans]
MKEVLKVEGLTKIYGGRKVVDDLSFSVKEGEIYGFLGPNGAGKTTAIKMILNLIKRDKGKVYIDGYDLDLDFKKAINNIAAIVEYPKFYLNFSAYDNLKIIKNYRGKVEDEKILEVLEIVGLKGREKDKVKTYSLGMKQRLGIAMTLINDPKIILLDEPTNGLDPKGIIEVRNIIMDLSKKFNKTVLVSSHLLHEIEIMCNNVVIINKGKTIAQGEVKTLINKDVDTIHVVTKEKEKLKELMDKIDYGNYANDMNDGLLIELKKNMSWKLIKELVENNIEVKYINEKNQSLEEIFIDIVGGE